MNPFNKDAARAYHLYGIDAPQERKFLKKQARRIQRRAGKVYVSRLVEGNEDAVEEYRGKKSIDRRDIY